MLVGSILSLLLTLFRKSTLSIHLELGLGSKLTPTAPRYGVRRSGHVAMASETRLWTPGSQRDPVKERRSWRMAELLVLPTR